ncbi:TauD/TfdA family dioxygenase [Streptomyces iconiensis]|uniref:TauD/TfdA family dioxygenase n=1 Tax=Streptomyces iconiensis TaxID=1384038 RepID=A0ABT7A6D0_9ACTN|nr:TauD/TfdA family dioxygenase [Streptomyces iconiensis]MDJ1136632.1 TauD/TfdA family dioxygenase [Streptomyces iconiensis]
MLTLTAMAGLGMGLFFVSVVNLVNDAVPAHQSGAGNGLLAVCTQLGAATGVAVLSSVLKGHTLHAPGGGCATAGRAATGSAAAERATTGSATDAGATTDSATPVTAFASAGPASAAAATGPASAAVVDERPVFDNGVSAAPVRELSPTGHFAPSAPYESFGLAPCSPTIGAEVSGVDLARPLTEELRAELHRSLLEWKVLFFRDQHFTAEQHRAMARWWGTPEVHPFLPKAEVPEVVRLARGADSPAVENVWHSDASFEATPPMGSLLRAVQVPAVGGDTLWADMAAAYDGLSAEMKTRLEGLRAVHGFTRTFGKGLGPEELARQQRKFPAVAHPVVRTHPETGRKLLYVNRIFTHHIDGMPREESDELLRFLCDQARHPEYQCRLRWQPGTLAFWDNRATQHYASADYYPHARLMERVTVLGDRPA